MRSRVVLGLMLTLAAAGCAQDEPPMPRICTDTDSAGYTRALAAAPGPVRLPGAVRISDCLSHVRRDADLQSLGAILHPVAEDLADRAGRGDMAAALALGYLGGAADVGGQRSNGVSAELAHRIAAAATRVQGPADVQLRRGEAAGRATG